MKTALRTLSILAVFALVACDPEPTEFKSELLDLPAVPYNYGNNDPYQATLGRVLFYDKSLSANNTVSCASCHKQAIAFTDDRRFSKGFMGVNTERNSMPIQNLRSEGGFSVSLFWDGREHMLESMVLQPIVNKIEMGVTDLKGLERELADIPYYPELFRAAFGSSTVTTDRIAKALAAFVATIESKPNKDTTFANLTGMEAVGATLFKDKYECNACHQVQSAHGYIEAGTFSNIGLDANYADNGLGKVTGVPQNNGKFKIPSLQNVALTAPYMHDGRFATLEEVIDHYSNGIKNHPNLDERLKSGSAARVFNITADEKRALIAFLSTLTDEKMIRDVRFSDPFKNP